MASSTPVDTKRRLKMGFVVALVTACAIAAAVYIGGLGPEPAEPGPPVQPAQALPSLEVTDPSVAVPAGKITPLEAVGKAPTPAGIEAQIGAALANPALKQFKGVIMDPASGQVLFDRESTEPVLPASTVKLLTGAALLNSIPDPQARLVTRVVVGEEEGDIVLVGGGDVTLSARSTGTATVYEGAPTVSDLAQQVIDSGYEVRRIVLDTTYWTGPELAEGWRTSDIGQGYIAPMQALMIDGARDNPANENSPRSETPALDAGVALAQALGDPELEIVPDGMADPEAQVLGQVESQPMILLLAQALQNSDNMLAESLGREIAGARGAPRSFQGATDATMLALRDLTITTDGEARPVDVAGVEIFDSSGISELNRAPAMAQAEVLVGAVQAQDTNMRGLITGLPVAGATGTLADRFCSGAAEDSEPCAVEPNAKPGRGWVRAKTGSIEVTYALAGLVIDKDDRILVFSFNSNGVDPTATRPAQDLLAATLRGCGCA